MDEFERGLESASKKFSDFSKNIESAGKKVSDIGSALTAKVTLPIGGLAVAATKMSMDFEGAMAKVGTIADTAAVPIDSLQSSIIGLSNETGIAAGDIANSVYNVISATGDTAGAVGLVSNATKLATAGFTDSESALSVLTTAINAYGLSSEQAAKISDSLIMTQNLGVTTVAELASNMGRAIATASAYGVGLENVEAAYVALTKGGISTAESTTYLSSMMNELGKSGSNVSKVLQEQTGMSFGQLVESGMSLGDVLGILYESTGRSSEGFINLWGSAEAGKAANTIVNQGLEQFNTNLQTISSSLGATQTAYETMQTSSFNLGKAFNKLKNAAIQFGDVLMPVLVPALTAVVEKATELVQWFTSLDSGTQNLILTIGGIAVAAGPVLTVFGNIVTAVGKISGGIASLVGIVGKAGSAFSGLFAILAANPIAAVIASVAALAAGIIVLWHTNEDFRNAVGAIWEAIKGFFVNAWEAIQAAWGSAGEFFGGVVDGIKGVFDGIGEFLGGLFTAAWEMVQDAWETATEFFSGIADGIHEAFEAVTSFLGDAFRAAWDAVSAVWDSATGFFGDILDNISGAAKKAGEAVGKAFKGALDAVKKAWDDAISFFSGIAQKIVGAFSDIGGKFLDIGRNIVDGIKNGISNAWSSFMSWLNGKVGGIVQGVKNMLGIHSPSTVFAGIGENMALGLISGWDDEYNGIKRKIESGLNFGTASVGVNTNYSGSSRYGAQEAAGRPGGWGNTYVTINSPESVDGVEAARVWKKETQKMAVAYV